MKLATFLVLLASAVPLAAQTAASPTVVFVCEHGAGKSVIATAAFAIGCTLPSVATACRATAG